MSIYVAFVSEIYLLGDGLKKAASAGCGCSLNDDDGD